MVKGSRKYGAVGSFYQRTRPVALALKAMMEVLLPETAARYQQAFEAGCCMEDDPGPFLGRAVVWKMQLSPHKDGGDVGHSISFGFGSYTGGHMIIPQLDLKLK